MQTKSIFFPRLCGELTDCLGINDFSIQLTRDGITTLWITRQNLRTILGYLKLQATFPYILLFDLTAIDERRVSTGTGSLKATSPSWIMCSR